MESVSEVLIWNEHPDDVQHLTGTPLSKDTSLAMGAGRIFSRGGQIMGLETKFLQRGRRMEPQWEYGGNAPEADDGL